MSRGGDPNYWAVHPKEAAVKEIDCALQVGKPSDRDRLAADLADADAFGWLTARHAEIDGDYYRRKADRLIALGWTRLTEERLAGAIARAYDGPDAGQAIDGSIEWYATPRQMAHDIAKELREDTDA